MLPYLYWARSASESIVKKNTIHITRNEMRGLNPRGILTQSSLTGPHELSEP